MNLDYAARQMNAVWRLAFPGADDPGRSLDASVDGVFRSAWALAFAALPTAVILLAVRRGVAIAGEAAAQPLYAGPLFGFFAQHAAIYLIGWTLDIAIIITVYRLARAPGDIARTIVAYNWSQPVVRAIQCAPALMIGFFGPAAGVFWFPALGLTLYFYWRIFRAAMGASAQIAVAAVALILMTGVLAEGIAPILAERLQPEASSPPEISTGAALSSPYSAATK